MKVNEDNIDKVVETIHHLTSFLIEENTISGTKSLNVRDRITSAMLSLETLKEYCQELEEITRD